MTGCVNVSDSYNKQYRLIYDYSINCQSSEYKVWSIFASYPILILFSLIFPLYIFLNLLYGRKHRLFLSKRFLS